MAQDCGCTKYVACKDRRELDERSGCTAFLGARRDTIAATPKELIAGMIIALQRRDVQIAVCQSASILAQDQCWSNDRQWCIRQDAGLQGCVTKSESGAWGCVRLGRPCRRVRMSQCGGPESTVGLHGRVAHMDRHAAVSGRPIR